MTTIRPDVVNMFYKGYINTKKHYVTVKEKKVDFGQDAINTLYGLEDKHNLIKTTTYHEEIPMNVGKIICQHMVEWVKHPRRIKPFPHLTKHFCIKACLELEKIPQITVMGGIWSDDATPNHMVSPRKEILEKPVDDPH
ncbi:hypothetical protein E5676_scaffold477G00940 [Cucumis melo var. makuwa]|uniref:Uncharacterized protein n=1 Tax=Cucumis melo var. makuwa TaxID=1194695 RepID=A0A5A7TLS1_CUCMM|nr:hypothetical protein E6C27_scaffold795G001070 [Cucumis melo var. makuwa]TYK15503.1 hypothetical protein E5676_scaffold477G00940 [Cucumis melo var. makuwa]